MLSVAAFVIMPNPACRSEGLPWSRQDIHIIWRMSAETRRENLQRDLLKITVKQINDILQSHEPEIIKKITINLKDRKLQVLEKKLNEH